MTATLPEFLECRDDASLRRVMDACRAECVDAIVLLQTTMGDGRLAPTDVFYATRLPFDPGSPAAASYVEEHWSPALLRFPTNTQAKAELNSALNYLARKTQRDLSLSGGASIVIRASQAGHHPLVLVEFRCKNDEGDPLGSPSLELLCG